MQVSGQEKRASQAAFDLYVIGADQQPPQFKEISAIAHKKADLRDTLVIVSLITGGLALLGGIFAGVKKAKIGWVGALLGLVGVAIAIVSGTHAAS